MEREKNVQREVKKPSLIEEANRLRSWLPDRSSYFLAGDSIFDAKPSPKVVMIASGTNDSDDWSPEERERFWGKAASRMTRDKLVNGVCQDSDRWAKR